MAQMRIDQPHGSRCTLEQLQCELDVSESDPEIRDQMQKILGRRVMMAAATSFCGYGTQALFLRNYVSVSDLILWTKIICIFEIFNGGCAYLMQAEGTSPKVRQIIWNLFPVGLFGTSATWGSIVLAPGVAQNPTVLLEHTMLLAVVGVMAVYNLYLHRYGMCVFHIGMCSGLVHGAITSTGIPIDLSVASVVFGVLCQIYGASARKVIRSLLISNAVNRKVATTLDSANKQLRELSNELRAAAFTDILTGCLNRRALLTEIERAFSACRRNNKLHICVVILDVDHFKRVNDKFGHDVGDAVLIEVGQVLRHETRIGDAVGRWGGEEFLCLLIDTDAHGGILAAEKIRKKMEETIVSTSGATITVSASFGVASFINDPSSADLIRRADESLYVAKSRGRNCVVCRDLDLPLSSISSVARQSAVNIQ